MATNLQRHQNLINDYIDYRWYISNNYVPYFVLYSRFLDNLRLLKGPLKLFLYCGLHADYSTGVLDKDFNTVAVDLGVGTRTIYNWLQKLCAAGLLVHQEKSLILQPYGIGPAQASHSKPELIANYQGWVSRFKEAQEPFFLIPYGFVEKLQPLSPGAVKMFLYCGITMNKETGHFYKSLETMAREINEKPRSVSNWLKELQDMRLIERHQLYLNMSSCTHVLLQNLNLNKKRPASNDETEAF